LARILGVAVAVANLFSNGAHAQESVCARVKIEIKQELTLERQAFDAEMRITNSLPATPLTDILVDVRVTDEVGMPVAITTDPNNLAAKFFLRQTQKQGISDTTGTGQVAAGSTATINWMLIPAPGASGNSPFGKRYRVGATLRY
jgi:CRISPR/Cas system CSM-associated protein Csm3 (group 7 of RAMP superfamily)